MKSGQKKNKITETQNTKRAETGLSVVSLQRRSGRHIGFAFQVQEAMVELMGFSVADMPKFRPVNL